MNNSIYKTLENLGLTSNDTKELFNDSTRDVKNLKVWRDRESGVIFIDDFYVGNEIYESGLYRNENILDNQVSCLNSEQYIDNERRFSDTYKFILEKKIIEFGCGYGDYLRKVKSHTKEMIGVELQKDYVEQLNKESIECTNNLSNLRKEYYDVCVSFHVIEHLENPIETLKLIREKIKNNGIIIIEVPHANDYLISELKNINFKKFTLWSQHLILHTRESLKLILEKSGFVDISISGIQRYPISNHINWMVNGKPGGHNSDFSSIDSCLLNKAYQESLNRIDATDTLFAIGKVIR